MREQQDLPFLQLFYVLNGRETDFVYHGMFDVELQQNHSFSDIKVAKKHFTLEQLNLQNCKKLFNNENILVEKRY